MGLGIINSAGPITYRLQVKQESRALILRVLIDLKRAK